MHTLCLKGIREQSFLRYELESVASEIEAVVPKSNIFISVTSESFRKNIYGICLHVRLSGKTFSIRRKGGYLSNIIQQLKRDTISQLRALKKRKVVT